MANAYVRPSVTASGVTWAQLLASGWSGHLEKLLAAQPQPGSPNAAPTSAPTTAANADGGSTLTTGTYFAVVTETNGFGETTAGPASTPGVSITSGTNHLTVTPPSRKSGNTASNIYIGTNSAGPFYLAAVGVTGATNIAAPIANSFASVAPPTANTTALSTKQIELIRSLKAGNAQMVIQHLHDIVSAFLGGKPAAYSSVIKHLEEADAAVSLLNTLIGEIGTLVVANPGTIKPSSNGIGNGTLVRQWP